MTETVTTATEVGEMPESVTEFAARARTWLAENMTRIDPDNPPDADRGAEEPWQRARELQRKLWDGGFAGICFPREYGGLGLPIAYQRAFDLESRCYEMPIILNTPTFTICAATILDMGSEEQKRQHIGGALRGDEVLVQLLPVGALHVRIRDAPGLQEHDVLLGEGHALLDHDVAVLVLHIGRERHAFLEVIDVQNAHRPCLPCVFLPPLPRGPAGPGLRAQETVMSLCKYRALGRPESGRRQGASSRANVVADFPPVLLLDACCLGLVSSPGR